MRSQAPPDIIFFNTGLHDLSTETSRYESALKWYVELLQSRLPNTKLVWVTTTAPSPGRVPPQWQNITTFGMVAIFNEVACGIMNDRRIPCIDTFLLSSLGGALGWYSDAVHLYESGATFYHLIAVQMMHELCRT